MVGKYWLTRCWVCREKWDPEYLGRVCIPDLPNRTGVPVFRVVCMTCYSAIHMWYLAMTEWILLSAPAIHVDIQEAVRRGDVRRMRWPKRACASPSVPAPRRS
jgi:hypothetical protein